MISFCKQEQLNSEDGGSLTCRRARIACFTFFFPKGNAQNLLSINTIKQFLTSSSCSELERLGKIYFCYTVLGEFKKIYINKVKIIDVNVIVPLRAIILSFKCVRNTDYIIHISILQYSTAKIKNHFFFNYNMTFENHIEIF